MPTSKATIMVTDCIKFINRLGIFSNFNFIRRSLILILGLDKRNIRVNWFMALDIGSHIESVWEIDISLIFLPAYNSFHFKSFQMKNKNLGQLVNVHLLCCKLMIFARLTIPLISLFQKLRILESLKTCTQRHLGLFIIIISR